MEQPTTLYLRYAKPAGSHQRGFFAMTSPRMGMEVGMCNLYFHPDGLRGSNPSYYQTELELVHAIRRACPNIETIITGHKHEIAVKTEILPMCNYVLGEDKHLIQQRNAPRYLANAPNLWLESLGMEPIPPGKKSRVPTNGPYIEGLEGRIYFEDSPIRFADKLEYTASRLDAFQHTVHRELAAHTAISLRALAKQLKEAK